METDKIKEIYENETEKLITETGVSFRDRVSNIDKEGNRIWIHPKKPKGRYHRARIVVSIFLIALLIAMPFIKIGGKPFMLFNILERKFFIFGAPFWPQDFFIFAIGFIALLIFVVLFTAIYGRLFCGWACPQTIFMELVFRKIEYWIDGDSAAQKRLALQEMNFEKFVKRALKHSIFFGLSFFIGNLLLAYIIGIEDLWVIITSPVSQHFTGFVAMMIFSLIFYFIFSWFREQACTYVCPYGRLQSVLLDKNSIVVAYDYVRGEPRGKLTKTPNPDNGDCIDCGACVKVCPTGIDIRNGTQLECVNCTVCIDACDDIMDKVKKPRGLIRYASINMIEEATKFNFTPRIIAYTSVLLLLVIVLSSMLLTRSDIHSTILRAKGTRYEVTQEGNVINVFTSSFINKTFEPIDIQLKTIEIPGEIKLVGYETLTVPADDILEVTFLLEVPKQYLTDTRNRIKIGVYSEGELLQTKTTAFSAPLRVN